MRSVLLLIVGVMVAGGSIGCGGPSETFDDKMKRMKAEVNRRSEAELKEKQKVVAKEARAMLPAKSAEDLVNAYKIAYAAGDITAIEQMSHFEGIEDAKTKKTVMGWSLGLRSSGESTIVEDKLLPLEESEKQRYPTVVPEKMLDYTSRANDDSSGSSTSVAIASVEGDYKFYFIDASKLRDPERAQE